VILVVDDNVKKNVRHHRKRRHDPGGKTIGIERDPHRRSTYGLIIMTNFAQGRLFDQRHILPMPHQPRTDVGGHTRLAPDDHRGAKLILQRLDPLRNRRLGETQPNRSAFKRASFNNGFQSFQLRALKH
jgi:hypothetical protein